MFNSMFKVLSRLHHHMCIYRDIAGGLQNLSSLALRVLLLATFMGFVKNVFCAFIISPLCLNLTLLSCPCIFILLNLYYSTLYLMCVVYSSVLYSTRKQRDHAHAMLTTFRHTYAGHLKVYNSIKVFTSTPQITGFLLEAVGGER